MHRLVVKPGLVGAVLVCALAVTAGPARAAPAGKQPAGKKTAGKKTAGKKATAKGAPQKQEELKEVMARRIQRATGQPARIHNLVYQVFTSTFLGQGIEVGPRGRPIVRIPRLRVELVLFSKTKHERGATFALVDVRGPVVTIPASWIERPYRRAMRQATVRLATVKDGRLTIRLKGGSVVVLSGINLRLSGLRVPATPAGKAPHLAGKVSLKVAGLSLPGLTLSNLFIDGELAGGSLKITRLTCDLPGGAANLAGTIGLGGARGFGPVALAGTIKARPFGEAGPQIEGQVKLEGRLADKLTLSGQLATPGYKGRLPRRGGTKKAPPMSLKMRLGKRRLRGSWRRWLLH